MPNQEISFTVSDPVESEYSITLPTGETEKMLELGEILLCRAECAQDRYVLPQLQQLAERTGRFVIMLMPGQELRNVTLKTSE